MHQLSPARHPHAGLRGRCPLMLLAATLAAMTVSRTAAQEPTATEVRTKIMSQARSALVDVELYLKIPSDEDKTGPAGAGETVAGQLQERQQDQVARDKKAIPLMGIIVAPRQVLVPDLGTDPERVDRWDVTDARGQRVAAKLEAILLDAPTVVLRPAGEEFTWEAPKFEQANVDPNTVLALLNPQRIQEDWVLNIGSVRSTQRWGTSAEPGHDEPFWVVGSITSTAPSAEALLGGGPRPIAPGLVFSATGQLIGAALTDRIYANRAIPPWRGSDLLNAPRMTAEQWAKVVEDTRSRFGAMLYPVRIEYRRPRGGAQALQDSELLGWAVSPRSLLIPLAMPRLVAAQINKITVQVGGRELEGEFQGQLNDFDACMISLAQATDSFPSFANLKKPGTVQDYRPAIALTVNRKYGGNDVRVDYTRKLGAGRGFANRLLPQLLPSPSLGSLLIDLQGDPCGIFARRRRPLEELEPYESQSTQIRLPQQSGSAELFTLADWAGVIENAAGHFDPRVVRKDEKEQDRRAWLGVEFNPLTRELAESLGCRKEAKDGSVGLMVSQIYAGSPAEKIGLRTGDVLLSIEMADRPRPIELVPPRGGRPGMPDLAAMRRGGAAPTESGSRAPWPSRNNYLTTLLAIPGADTTVQLNFWRGGKLEHTSFSIAQAPPDQDSADQFKDEQLGLTVKELTYEVRAALRMKPEDPGVVVVKVESGAPAGRARINPFEIIQAADGEAISSPAKFEQIIKQAMQEKKEQLRLTVVDRGRSRFADLKLQ